ncbi:YHS domain-containing (seleno)protein [Coraliomargarita akajimensis]|uniref:YHS domain protein n=1 Tax=Coraliomargarita akajimensis (strain DSM 45221 / IAM 15411 / JCM 23193 / KCTC 12865 / 04OKA010-24) TaxID=583355 RepID=D5EKN5_CORAD|nr:YHS domain-containing (seleno)protein [Coraliomargarita akajimensis]ADE54942.1 hypothetical protein Caka_1924 [Coraliomargarita akajimensis DSM 45221]
MKSLYTLLALFCLLGYHSLQAQISSDTRRDEFSLSRGHLALDGYDPVSYFTAKTPSKGQKSITTTHQGLNYRFSSKANKERFLESPDKYEAAYGGWCAWAMLEGERTKPNPKSYKIVAGRLLLFYDGLWGDTLESWNKRSQEVAEADLIQTADAHWAQQIR